MVIISIFFSLLKLHASYFYCSTTAQKAAERTLTLLHAAVPCVTLSPAASCTHIWLVVTCFVSAPLPPPAPWRILGLAFAFPVAPSGPGAVVVITVIATTVIRIGTNPRRTNRRLRRIFSCMLVHRVTAAVD